MKQEKKQTVSPKCETWQQIVLEEMGKNRRIVLSFPRRSGKSQLSQIMQMGGSTFGGSSGSGTSIFQSPWSDWHDIFVWPWNKKMSIESGKMVWGKIMVREHRVMYDGNTGALAKEYATKKEVFQRKLRGTG